MSSIQTASHNTRYIRPASRGLNSEVASLLQDTLFKGGGAPQTHRASEAGPVRVPRYRSESVNLRRKNGDKRHRNIE